MRDYLNSQYGNWFCDGLDDDAVEFYYNANRNYGLCLYDTDRWAWLNTLFGYDIGADYALGISNWFYDNGLDVLELDSRSKGMVADVCFALGYKLSFKTWASETPKAMQFSFCKVLKRKSTTDLTEHIFD